MFQKTISVIMPAFNCEKYIASAIESVLDQSYINFELIIINDGSTDKTLSVIKTFANRDERIKLIDQKNSGKPSITRNVGLQKAQGEYICFLDGDDLYHPEKLAYEYDILENNTNLNLVFHDVLYVKSNIFSKETYLEAVKFQSRLLPYFTEISENTYICDTKRLFLFMCTDITTLHTSAVFMRKSFLDEQPIAFPEDLTIGEDIDLWFRLVKAGGIAYTNQVLSYYRQHSQSLTKKPDRNIVDSIITHTINYGRSNNYLSSKELSLYKKRISSDYFNLAYNFFKYGDIRNARQNYITSLKWYTNFRTVLSYLKTFIPGA